MGPEKGTDKLAFCNRDKSLLIPAYPACNLRKPKLKWNDKKPTNQENFLRVNKWLFKKVFNGFGKLSSLIYVLERLLINWISYSADPEDEEGFVFTFLPCFSIPILNGEKIHSSFGRNWRTWSSAEIKAWFSSYCIGQTHASYWIQLGHWTSPSTSLFIPITQVDQQFSSKCQKSWFSGSGSLVRIRHHKSSSSLVSAEHLKLTKLYQNWGRKYIKS